MTLPQPLRRAAAFGLALLLLASAAAQAQDATALRARHDAIAAALAASPFGRPLHLDSNDSASQPQGQVDAIVLHPFATVRAALTRPADWCDVLLLQLNVKRCRLDDASTGAEIRAAVARKNAAAIEGAFELAFKLDSRVAPPDYLRVQMRSEAGPMGTRDYRLVLEAVALDDRRTFVRMSYAYSAGLTARLATEAYLATAGRSKVGFTTVADDGGPPRLVGGMRGIAERNTMRYFLAVEAVLDALGTPADQRAEKRLRQWFDATERYPRQLHEMDLDDYLAMKRRELRG